MFTRTVFCPPGSFAGLVPGSTFRTCATRATRATQGHDLNQNASPVHWGDKLPDLGRDARHWASRVHQEVKKCRVSGFAGCGMVRLLFDWRDEVH